MPMIMLHAYIRHTLNVKNGLIDRYAAHTHWYFPVVQLNSPRNLHETVSLSDCKTVDEW